MTLPCIKSCHKTDDGGFYFLLNGNDEDGNVMEAHLGDVLCEDEFGVWHVERNVGWGRKRNGGNRRR